jgi:hypothetical protein
MTDVYADVTLTGNLTHVTTAQLAAIDLLASLFAGGPDWRVRIEVDPGTVITATPPRDTTPPETPSEAPLAPEHGEDG